MREASASSAVHEGSAPPSARRGRLRTPSFAQRAPRTAAHAQLRPSPRGRVAHGGGGGVAARTGVAARPPFPRLPTSNLARPGVLKCGLAHRPPRPHPPRLHPRAVWRAAVPRVLLRPADFTDGTTNFSES